MAIPTPRQIEPELKRCSKCREWKALDNFSKDNHAKDGLCYQCKKCRALYQALHKENTRKYCRKFRNKPNGKFCIICGKLCKGKSKYYCSHKCSNIALIKGKIVKCSYCGKNFYRSLSYISRSKRVFCSHKCRTLYYLGDKTYNWKGGRNATYKKQKILRDQLADSYIKALLCNRTILESADISNELVELKREHLRMKRLLWSKK